MHSGALARGLHRICPRRLFLVIVSAGMLGWVLAGCVSQSERSVPRSAAALPRDTNTLIVGAEMALQQKQFVVAAQALAAAAAQSDDERLAERATRVAFEYHQNGLLEKSARRWLELNSTSEEARRFAGVAALRLYRIDQAVEHFAVLLRTAYISPSVGFIALTPQLLEEGNRPAVMALLKKLAEKFPNTAEAHYSLAQAALAADNHALALHSAQRAVELSPYWMLARAFLARAQSAADQHDAALATMREVLAQEDKPERRLEYAHLLYTAKQVDEARAELDRLSTNPELAAAAQRLLAAYDMDSGQYDAAAKRYRELVTSGRFVYEGMFRLAQIAERRGALDDAFELYSRVLDTDYALVAQSRAARLKARSGAVADGLALLRKFRAERPELAIETITAEAAYLADQGQGRQALQTLKDALTQYPDHHVLRYALALQLERMNRIPEALRVMRALLKDRPEDPTALNMLGYTLVDRKQDTRGGYAMIKAALELIPDNAAVLDSMGWALYRLNRPSEALPYLERALKHGRDPEITLHLGDVLWALGRRDEARAAWMQALEETPDHAALKERLEKRGK